jgi:hypothetical protein
MPDRKKRTPLSAEAKQRMTEKRRATIAAKSIKNNNEERSRVFKLLSEIQGYGLLDYKRAQNYLKSTLKFDDAKSSAYISAYMNDPTEPLDTSDYKALCERLASYYKVVPYT